VYRQMKREVQARPSICIFNLANLCKGMYEIVGSIQHDIFVLCYKNFPVWRLFNQVLWHLQ
jgi:hypothetical protein